MNTYHRHISVIGECCPVPLIRISQAINELARGEILSVTGDDPVFEITIRDYCLANQLEIVEVTHLEGREVNALIKK